MAPSSGGGGARAANASGSSWSDRGFLAALLATGTCLALYGQVVTNAVS